MPVAWWGRRPSRWPGCTAPGGWSRRRARWAVSNAPGLPAPTRSSSSTPTTWTQLSGRFTEAAGGGVDLVLDPLYGVPAAAAARSLRPGGRLVNLGSSAHEHAPIDSSTLRSKSLRLLGYTNNELSVERRADAISAVASYAAQGRLSVAREVLPLESVAEAWTASGRGPDAPGGSC